ncbi:hypothetical protein Bca101_006648 [Brassica carinata]
MALSDIFTNELVQVRVSGYLLLLFFALLSLCCFYINQPPKSPSHHRCRHLLHSTAIAVHSTSTIKHSIVGIRSRVESEVELRDTIVMGADFYQTETEIMSMLAEGKVPISVGENTKIRNCMSASLTRMPRLGKTWS